MPSRAAICGWVCFILGAMRWRGRLRGDAATSQRADRGAGRSAAPLFGAFRRAAVRFGEIQLVSARCGWNRRATARCADPWSTSARLD